MDADEQEDVIRAPQEVARRALALFASFGVAAGADRREVMEWLTECNLYGELTPIERRFVDNASPAPSERMNRSWDSERLVMLVWALGCIPRLPADDEQCDTSVFQDLLPPFSGESAAEFIAKAALRPASEISAMAEHCLKAHWHARDAKLRGGSPAIPVDIEIIQERHHAINWVTGYDGGLAWDDVTTDT